MLRSVRCLRSINVISRRNYQVAKLDKSLQTTHEDITAYGSYKNNIFTHRLPESSAQQSPLLVALHSRLRLPDSYSLSTLSQALNITKSTGLANNFGLQTLGKNLLSYYITEYLLLKYPRLPMPVHNEAVNSLMGTNVLAEIGKLWGIETDVSDELKRFLGQEPEFMKYGKLRFSRKQSQESGVYELNNQEIKSIKSDDFVSEETNAYASAVRAIIGGLYTHCGEESTKKFIDDYFLTRKIPLENMFQFRQPTRELVRLCDKLDFKNPLEIRLIAETGRLSASPIFVVGTFCGEEKLGEGVGSSLREAKTRSVVNALMSYYLYSPITSTGEQIKLPSDQDYKFEGIVGMGDVAI
jgi:large subunit ribosomal protein L44